MALPLLGLQLAVDTILISQGLGKYSTLGAFGVDTDSWLKPKEVSFSQEQLDWFENSYVKNLIRTAKRNEINAIGRDNAALTRRRIETSRNDLNNRKNAIAALPTSNDLQLAASIKNNVRATPRAAPPPPQEDKLADAKARLERANNEASQRVALRGIQQKEFEENAAEERAKSEARQQQIEGQKNLLIQRQGNMAKDLTQLQKMSESQNEVIQKFQSQTAAADAAVLKAEQEQKAKTLAATVPRRLPPSVKLGGSKKMNLIKRLMAESDMTKKEAMQYIKTYGI